MLSSGIIILMTIWMPSLSLFTMVTDMSDPLISVLCIYLCVKWMYNYKMRKAHQFLGFYAGTCYPKNALKIFDVFCYFMIFYLMIIFSWYAYTADRHLKSLGLSQTWLGCTNVIITVMKMMSDVPTPCKPTCCWYCAASF